MRFIIPIVLSVMLLSVACNTKHEATINFSYMDTTVRAQDDFYRYACGKWSHYHPMPDEHGRFDAAQLLKDSVAAQLHAIVTDIVRHPQEAGSNSEKLAKFYLSGMDTAAINAAGIKPIKFFLDTIDAMNSPADLQGAFALLQRHYINAPFYSTYGPYIMNSNRYAFMMGEDGLGLEVSDYYVNNNDDYLIGIREEYKKHIRNMFVLMGQDSATAQKSAKAAYGIEDQLAKCKLDKTQKFEWTQTYHNADIDYLKKEIPLFDWPKYFSQLGVPIPDTIVIYSGESYFSKLNNIMCQTPIDDWKAYLKFRVMSVLAFALDSGFVNENFHFKKHIMSGMDKNDPRWKQVLDEIIVDFDDALSQLYVERHFSPSAKQRAIDLTVNIKTALGEHIASTTWMCDSTKAKALDKLASTKMKIGYPDDWNDYSSYTMGDLYGDNVIMCMSEYFKYEMSFINKPINNDLWYECVPHEANMFFVQNLNEVMVPAAMLQPPFFFADGDDAVNYGAMGAAIGHEMSHGFDLRGCQFDKHGNLGQWWSDGDKEEFDKLAQKLIDRFNSFIVIDSIHADGEYTLDENLADLCGLIVSYTAFSKTEQWKDQTKLIDGLTPDQRFFLAYAQTWAGSYRDEEIRKRTQTDDHSLFQFRVEGPLPYLEPFEKSFGTKPGDRYYLPDSLKVKIW